MGTIGRVVASVGCASVVTKTGDMVVAGFVSILVGVTWGLCILLLSGMMCGSLLVGKVFKDMLLLTCLVLRMLDR